MVTRCPVGVEIMRRVHGVDLPIAETTLSAWRLKPGPLRILHLIREREAATAVSTSSS